MNNYLFCSRRKSQFCSCQQNFFSL